jgi:hypothetical protein
MMKYLSKFEGKDHFGDLDLDGRVTSPIKMDLKEVVCGLD